MEMKVKACLRSGFCCKKGPCGFGESISNSNPQCSSLELHQDGTTSCGKYEEISQHPFASFSPAFGAGCCMPLFNDDRARIKNTLHGGQEQYVTLHMPDDEF